MIFSNTFKSTLVGAFKPILSSFIFFIIAMSFASSDLVTKIIANVKIIIIRQSVYSHGPMIQNQFNQMYIEKTVLSRNIFNITGEIPAEEFEGGKNENTEKNFSQIPCSPETETLPVNVLGIIYTGNQTTSLVTVKDPDIDGADVYHVGDKILDYPNYSVYRIVNPTLVEFRFGSKKICRSLVSPLAGVVQNSENHIPSTESSLAGEENTVTLSQEYVNGQLAGGLITIVNSARIAPSMVNGKLDGFKIFAITEGSVFDKIGLQNGDIVTQINNQPLDDPAKGFLIYDTFRYENQSTFTIQRGTNTVTRRVIIK